MAHRDVDETRRASERAALEASSQIDRIAHGSHAPAPSPSPSPAPQRRQASPPVQPVPQPGPSPAPRPAPVQAGGPPPAPPSPPSTGGGSGNGGGFKAWAKANELILLGVAILCVSLLGLVVNRYTGIWTKEALRDSADTLQLIKRIESGTPTADATPSQSATNCVSPDPGGTRFSAPILAEPGFCIKLPAREPHGTYFWMTMKSVPVHFAGVAQVNTVRLTGKNNPDGSPDYEPEGTCDPRNCGTFISQHLGQVLFVRQASGQPLDIRF